MKFTGYGPKWNECEFCGLELDLPRKPKIGDRLRHSEQTIDKHDWILRHELGMPQPYRISLGVGGRVVRQAVKKDENGVQIGGPIKATLGKPQRIG